jgi:hypothetical protein
MFKHLQQLIHYVKTGKGQQIGSFPWISTDFNNFANPELLQTPGSPSSYWFDDYGNTFVVRRAAGAISQGDVVTWGQASGSQAVATPFSTDTATGASTVRVITLTTGGLTANAEVGNFVFDDTIALAADKIKEIKANTANTLTVATIDTRVSNLQNDANAYSVAPANADALTIIRPHYVVRFPVAQLATAMPMGVSVQAITSQNWGFVQVDGLAAVSGKGDVTAIVAGSTVVPDGVTAGFVKGGGAPAANAVGTSCVAHAAATGLIPVWLQLLSQS